MKTYVGEHFGTDGVFVDIDGQRHPLDPRFDALKKWEFGFAWGRFIDPKSAHLPIPLAVRPIHPGAAQLAFAILADHFRSVEVARRAYMRFAYRVLAEMRPDEPMVVTVDEIEATLAAIKQVEFDESTKQMKQTAARERPVPVTEYGADIIWDSFEEPKINKPPVTN